MIAAICASAFFAGVDILHNVGVDCLRNARFTQAATIMTILRKLRWLFDRSRKEIDLHDEIAFHLSEEAEERGDAAAARRDLGNATVMAEDTRAAWSWTWLEQLLQDL